MTNADVGAGGPLQLSVGLRHGGPCLGGAGKLIVGQALPGSLSSDNKLDSQHGPREGALSSEF